MHIRRGRYIGVAPVAGGSTNVCLVKPSEPGTPSFADPATMLLQRARARSAAGAIASGGRALLRPPVVLGPLAVETSDGSIDGLLLAGDAPGFIDPMTGDGLRFAVRGGELAAPRRARRARARLERRPRGGFAAPRRQEFGAKWRFNRALRALVGAPLAIRVRGGRGTPHASGCSSNRRPRGRLRSGRRSNDWPELALIVTPMLVLAVVFVPMLLEAAARARNERAQRARGGIEPAGDVYTMMAIAYPTVFLAMIGEGAAARSRLRRPRLSPG